MSLESICSSRPCRAVFTVLRLALGFVEKVNPGAVGSLCHKLREFFSPRVNKILLAELITKNRWVASVPCAVECIEMRSPLLCRLTLDVKDYTQGDFYFSGFPDFTVHLLRFSDGKTLFFDLGANGGLVSLAMSHFLPHSHIFAFEPIPVTYERLRCNFQNNCPSANTAKLALSSSPGMIKMSIPDTDSGSASASTNPDGITSLHGCKARATTHDVECATFDAFFEAHVADRFSAASKFAFKIDVEGHELETLTGMSAFLSRNDISILMVVEVRRTNGQAVHELLSSLGMYPKEPSMSASRISGHHIDCLYLKEPGPGTA